MVHESMKKSIIAALFLVFVLFIVFFPLGSMILMNEPFIQVQNIKATEITWSTIHFDVTIAIRNPYPFKVIVTDLSYTVVAEHSDGSLLLATSITEGMEDITVAGSSIADILVPAKVYNSELMAAGIELFTQGDVDVLVLGSAKVDLKLFQPEIPFSKQFTLTREELLMEITGTTDLIHDIKSEIRNTGIHVAFKLLFPS